jgi:hypothetical protein
MMTSARKLFVLSAMVALLLALVAGSPAEGATTAKSTLKSLVKQTNKLPKSVVSKRQKHKLTKPLRHALKFVTKKPCRAVADLNRYRRILRGVKVPKGSSGKARRTALKVSKLGPASVKASQKLLASSKTKACGGGVKPSTRPETTTTVMSSDENGLTVRVQLPVLHFLPESGGGKTFTKLVAPDTDSPGAPGTPGIPTVSSNFGVPDGATAKVTATSSTSYTMQGVDVFPAQPDPVDADSEQPNFLAGPFKQPPFQIDNAAYSKGGLVPAAPADGGLIGTYRDIAIGDMQIPTAQYNPAAKTLKVLNTVDVQILFQGGNHTFSDEFNSPWEFAQQRVIASLLNFNTIRSRLDFILRRCGEEMLVITNPATQAAADSFATAKRNQGMRTNVFQTGAGSGQIGTTPAEIQTFIRGRLNAFLCIHPSYVTIMGDDDLVPTFAGINGIPSDLQYSMKTDADELPDVAVGRFIGNDQAAIQTAVNKVIGYETTAPTDNGMLNKATIAAQFQDDDNDGQENRTFVWFAEKLRNGLVARGVTVDRIYGESPGNNPQRLNDGTALPAALLKPTFGWNGTGAQVSTAWNEGRFLMVHRDHGWSDGWGTPGYGTANVQALTNGAKLPVVLSINCSSGAYDYDETSFAGESLVKADGGSVGVFGDTRDSPTWHNSQIALGFADALLPSILPSEGPASKQRTGNALIAGKLRLAGLSPPGTDGNTRNELYLWHYFGDPSMQMWGGGQPPFVVNAGLLQAIYKAKPGTPGDPPYEVNVSGFPAEVFGQPISLLRNGQVVGRAFVNGDGTAKIPASFGDGSVKPGDLEVAGDADGAQPVKIPVSGVPADTTLTQTCPDSVSFNDPATVTGNLAPAFAGGKVVVTWTRPDGRGEFEHQVTTDAQGNWSDTISTLDDDPGGGGNGGTWQERARFDGDAGHNPSRTETCTFQELGG